jgi:DNA-directed RNA polymerase specialized sigma24 family protein
MKRREETIKINKEIKMIEEIQAKIKELPLTHSIVIELLYLNKYSYEETAEYLNMTSDRVRQLETSALRRMALVS